MMTTRDGTVKKRLLVQTQLSNYDPKGNFILECDSGWQMVIGRVREMLKLNQELDITVMGPNLGGDGQQRQVITDPWDINLDLWGKYGPGGEDRLHYFEHRIIPNALVTRYDFNWTGLACGLDLGMQKIGKAPKYDAVYINDPMHLRNFKAMFHVVGGYQPEFYVHSHFVDVPSCPKFPEEASLWFGQLEAAHKADWNFWQCESALKEFEREADEYLKWNVVSDILLKSSPWDDGYSREEITALPDEGNMRFTAAEWREKVKDRVVIFVPNRIGGKGRSSDYTNCGKFMFEQLPQLRKLRSDFVIVCGNPSQKITNAELEAWCGRDGYISLVSDAFNRDEFKFVATHSQISVGLYDQDTYGGTVARECVELGCMPLWLNLNEYSSIAREAGGYPFLCKPDFSDLVQQLDRMLTAVQSASAAEVLVTYLEKLQAVVRARCSYEATTPAAMRKMNLLP